MSTKLFQQHVFVESLERGRTHGGMGPIRHSVVLHLGEGPNGSRRLEVPLDETAYEMALHAMQVGQTSGLCTLAIYAGELPDDDGPKFRPGDRVRMNCEGKAEHGVTGVVFGVHEYTGPRMYARWEYRLHDVRWSDGTAVGSRWNIRESWLEAA